MARIIYSDQLDDTILDPSHKYWVYNAFDACITEEVRQKLEPQHDQFTQVIYNFERALQAPALEMMLRGIRVDNNVRMSLFLNFQKKAERLDYILQRYADAVWDKPLNPRSPQQLIDFFYTRMKIPPVISSKKGQKKVSTDREALEKIKVYYHARPIVEVILGLRDALKKMGVLKKGIDPDGRFRTSYNITGTETGRWSSSANAFGTGDNGQNLTEELRRMFVADPGMKMAYIDLEQAESRLVALLAAAISGRSNYWDACHSGDLHTIVARMVWPDLPWTGDIGQDKKVAESPFYRHFSYRDMAKRGGHGTNYYGTPYTMARHLKVEAKVMEGFQFKYFSAFPEIPEWHRWTAQQLQTQGVLVTPLWRKRYFFGRRFEDETLRSAIAHVPQSTIGDILNLALFRVWKLSHRRPIQLLAQVHDAILIQYPEELENEILPEVLATMQIPFTYGGRTLAIPTEAAVGWNWSKYVSREDAVKKGVAENEDGLKKWKAEKGDARKRSKDTTDNRLHIVIP